MTAIRKAFEAHFHSDEQVSGYIAKASGMVNELEIADDLREAAFTKAVELLAQKQVTFEAVNPAGVLLNQRPQGFQG